MEMLDKKVSEFMKEMEKKIKEEIESIINKKNKKEQDHIRKLMKELTDQGQEFTVENGKIILVIEPNHYVFYGYESEGWGRKHNYTYYMEDPTGYCGAEVHGIEIRGDVDISIDYKGEYNVTWDAEEEDPFILI